MQSTETEKPIFPKVQPLDMKRWQIIIGDWERGKETQKNYCERLGISINSFVYARSKLAQNKKTKPTFIPVKLNQPEDQKSQIADIVTIENPQGLKLHISSDLSLDHLAKILNYVDGKMLKLRDEIKIYVSMEPIDARKSIDGLCALIIENFDDNPQGGNLLSFLTNHAIKSKLSGGMPTALYCITSVWRKDDLWFLNYMG